MQEDIRSQMRALSRQHLKLIWDISGMDEATLNDEDRLTLDIMRRHPEYYDLWARLDEVSEEELERDGTNPVMHLIFHQTVENQLAGNNPAEVARALDRLMGQGKTRHDAIHEIGVVLAEEMFEMMKFGRVYDDRKYNKKLRRLGRSRRNLRKRH